MANKYNKHNKRNNHKAKREKEIPSYINDIISEINDCEMLSKIDITHLVDIDGIAYQVAGYAVDYDMKNTQLRSFFDAIKKMERNGDWEDIKPEFILLKPRMAVRVGRGKVEEGFFKVIEAAMNKIDVGSEEDIEKNFKVFVEFFEAIIAYHKYLGEGDV